jgi:hyperosmotically inducible periplasmic protein
MTTKEGITMGLGRLIRGWAGALLAFLTLVLVSSTSTLAQRSIGDVIDDAVITAKVKSSFAADPQVSALAIDVDTANGVVSLTGVVTGEHERQRAIQLAQGTEGVKRVEAQNLRLQRTGAGVTREGEHAMSGTITAINHSTGVLSLRTSAGEFTFHFPPPATRGLKEGDTITVHLAFEKGSTERR